MGNRKRGKRSQLKAVSPHDECRPCRESTKTVKARYTKAKKEYKQIVLLALNEAFDYDVRDEIVGKACLKVNYLKKEYNWSKQLDKEGK